MTDQRVFTKRMTVEEMAEQSRKATAEGMRELAAAAAAFATRKQQPSVYEDSDCDWESEHESPKMASIEKLESRIHYLTLDLTNATVELDDANLKIDQLSLQMTPFRRVNDELTYLKSSLTRALKDTGGMNKNQLELRFKLFREEANEHAALCNASIGRIELDEVKQGMLRVLNSERRRILATEKSFKWVIFVAHLKELTLWSCTWLAVFMVVVAILYKMLL
jgi:hypothetical protein